MATDSCKYCSATYEAQPGRPSATCPECWKPIHARQMQECRDRRFMRELHASILRIRKKVRAVGQMAQDHADEMKRLNEEQKRMHRPTIFPCEIGAQDTQDAVRRISEAASRPTILEQATHEIIADRIRADIRNGERDRNGNRIKDRE